MYDLKEEKKAKDKLGKKEGKSSENGKTISQINAEYFQALEQWLNDVRSYKYSCSVFAGLPCSMMTAQMGSYLPSQSQSSNVFAPRLAPPNQGLGMFMFPNHQQPPVQSETGIEYIIPPLWKRFIAETVDFILLFFMKFTITFIAVDFFDFIDLRKYESFEKLDLKAVLEVTSEITILEVAYRLIVCLYEGIFLRKGIQNQVGGATPGKTFMGIRVILCNSIEQVQNQPNVVKVIPATDLGFGWSLARALLKNLVLTLLLPACFPLFVNRFNRTTYDILCHSVVVEDRVQTNRNSEKDMSNMPDGLIYKCK